MDVGPREVQKWARLLYAGSTEETFGNEAGAGMAPDEPYGLGGECESRRGSLWGIPAGEQILTRLPQSSAVKPEMGRMGRAKLEKFCESRPTPGTEEKGTSGSPGGVGLCHTPQCLHSP